MEAQCVGRQALEWVWGEGGGEEGGGALAPSQVHHQALLPVIRTFLFQERWNSKVGSRTTPDVVLQGITMDEVAKSLVDLKQMIPVNDPKFVVWEISSTEQGNWPTEVLVSMWFRSATNLATIIELLRVVIDELEKKPHELEGQVVTARLEMIPRRKPLAKESSCVVLQRHQKQGRGRVRNQRCVREDPDKFVGDAIAAKYTLEAGRLAGEGGNLKIGVIQPICAEELFEAIVNNALQRSQS